MSKSTKAALFSGLAFPGAGHLYLKSYPRAFALISVVAICLGIYITEAIKQSQSILEKIEAQGGTMDVYQISELASQSLDSSNAALLSISSLLILACWIFGVIDSYRLGKKPAKT